MVKQADLSPEELFCPRCQAPSRRADWVPVFRRLRGPHNEPPVRVLKHKQCSELVYFLITK